MSLIRFSPSVCLATAVACAAATACFSSVAADSSTAAGSGSVSTAAAVAPAQAAKSSGSWTARRLPVPDQPGPLARLIRTPDTSGGAPPYALTDQTGTIQRYVEPVPGIDLEAYVGDIVQVRHDTGETLLATQLDLPGPNRSAGWNAPTPTYRDNTPAATAYTASQVPPIQTVQYVDDSGAPVMVPPGVVPFNPNDPTMAGAPWFGSQQGVAPIYIDDPNAYGCPPCPDPCAGQACPTPGMWVMPGNMACQQPCCPQPCPQPCQQVCVQQPEPLRFSVWAEVLWLHPTGVDMAHAQQQNGIGGAGTVPWGTIGVTDPGYDLGYRGGAEYRFAPDASVFGTYTWFQSDSVSSLSPPTIPGGGGAVGSLVIHPGAALTASVGPVNASYDIDFQLADVAYRQILVVRPNLMTSVFLGARYGHLDQNFRQTGVFGGGAGGVINTSSDISVDAIGPMAGAEAERQIGCSRFSVYGRAMVAALDGEFHSHYVMYNATADALLAESVWTDDRIVPMLDYELGVAWTGPERHLRLAAGFMASHWFNIVSTPVFIDAVQADNYVNVDDRMSFSGLVGRVEWRW